jgi:hypothetical protein
MWSKAVRFFGSDSNPMAIFIPGMSCSISGERIDSIYDAVIFPAFVSNEADPLYVFSDAIISADIFHNHPLAVRAQTRYEEFKTKTAPQARVCSICGERITDPEDYLALGYLVDDPANNLSRHNYGHFHRSCLRHWPGLSALVGQLQALSDSGLWKGCALMRLIGELDSLRPNREEHQSDSDTQF